MPVLTSIGVVVLLPARFQPVLSAKGYETVAANAAKNKDEQAVKPMMRLAAQALPARWKHLPSKRHILVVKANAPEPVVDQRLPGCLCLLRNWSLLPHKPAASLKR